MSLLFNKGHLSLSVKLTIGVIGMLLFGVISVGCILYYLQGAQLEQAARHDIENTIAGLETLFRQTISHTLSARLQSTTALNRDIADTLYRRSQTGEITEDAAKQLFKDILLGQKIGDSGYLSVIDSTGTVQVHPTASLEKQNLATKAFVREQLERKTGYLEFEQQFPGEESPRPMALAMAHFKPWDYIISATARRDEIRSIVDFRVFESDVKAVKFGSSGYAYVMDPEGTLLIHPDLKGVNIYKSKDASGWQFIAEMCKKKNGHISYPWKNPGEKHTRVKDVFFKYDAPLDIIIAGGIYRDELYAPLSTLRNRLLIIIAVILLISIPSAYIASKTLADPVLRVSALATRIAQRDLRAVGDFEAMAVTQKNGKTWIGRGSEEILVLLDALRDAGISIRDLLFLLKANAEKLSEQQGLIETAAGYTNTAASKQSTMVGNVSSAVEEMEQAFNRTYDMAKEMHTLAGKAVVKFSEGRTAVDEAEQMMNVISDRSETTQKEILHLGKASDQIEGLVHMVQDITRHSQLLSVNARIQAAQAGTAGRGFSVVAAEVRKLAIQSAESTDKIKATLRSLQESSMDAIIATAEGAEAVAKGRESIHKLAKIIGNLNRVIQLNRDSATEISEIVGQQSNAIARISSAVAQVTYSSQKGTNTADGLMQAVEELKQTQKDLTSLVQQYKV